MATCSVIAFIVNYVLKSESTIKTSFLFMLALVQDDLRVCYEIHKPKSALKVQWVAGVRHMDVGAQDCEIKLLH